MGLYENVRDVAKLKGYSINRLEKELGFARSSISKFNKNVPSVEKLRQISEFLEVPIETLTSGKYENGLTLKDNLDISKDLHSLMEKLSSKDSGPASFDGEEIPEADLELFEGQLELMLRRLKAINKEKYNPHKNKK